ncbi:MAG: hypothetical protein K2K02_06215 [Ruminococcus sp.]|nr:hypothetical protein [Ruminococcus sp.]
MDKIGRTKQELRLMSWMDMYTEYQVSGKTIQVWCIENDVNIKTFYYRLRKVRKAMLEPSERYDIVPVKPAMPDFEKAPADVIRITGKGIAIKLPETVSAEILEVILRGMSQC